MSEPSIMFFEVNERQGVFHRRAFLMGGLAGGGLMALGGRLAQLQLVEAQRYQKLSAGNQFNYRLTPPPRGLILDRNGVALASNRPNFRLMVSKDSKDFDVETALDDLALLVPIDAARRARLVKDIARAPKKAPVAVMEDMTWEEFSRVNIRAPELPGVTADMGEVRVYPFGGAFAHVIGYVAKVSDRDLEKAKDDPTQDQDLLHHPGFRIGKAGIEKSLDRDLRGRPGATKAEVDAQGRVVRLDPEGDIPATPGKEVRLTLDADIQNRALEVMGDESGAIVVMDIRNGDLLAMVSAPSFDANRFVKGLSGPEYKALAEYERKPLLDKVLNGTFPPGSTFKPTVGLAALTAGIDPEVRVSCGGSWYYGGRTWRCWQKGGHGSQNLHEAIKNSCDIYFYQTSLKIGPDAIASAARAMGFGSTFDIGIPGQKKGLVPDREWKKRAFKKNPANQIWFPGETPSYGIGQGALSVNALQLAVMTSRLANGKKALNPRLIKSVGGVEQPSGAAVPDLPFSMEHLAYVRGGMAAVANDVRGTAYRQSQLGLGDVQMAGKTGTAQVRSYDKVKSRNSASVQWKLKDHNLFVAFAPYDDPRYAVAVIVEHGGLGGATAGAPRAREVMRVALLKDPEIRARIERPMPLPAEPVEAAPDGSVEGAAPDDPTVGTAPTTAVPTVPASPAPGVPR
ncbi:MULTISPECIES: penicillin-binding protein 2 [Caulobacter]|jgi:penicillin-binding protein 2|uniref:penicillin-binding protein 2 n=1 Tax=Caulobacter TaxID=75 RepID=UPI0006F3A231|nr:MULTISPECIES: penicillin-binding protein 2 [Caulobacter]KQZ19017.1 penicillin-binding protein 2 [Caulobacter sp. Root1472]GGL40012.1 penicillin-binding protein 2 [Caulobacter rhizosphaerae]